MQGCTTLYIYLSHQEYIITPREMFACVCGYVARLLPQCYREHAYLINNTLSTFTIYGNTHGAQMHLISSRNVPLPPRNDIAKSLGNCVDRDDVLGYV